MIEIVAGTPPGGGLDRTARALAKAFDEAGALDTAVVVKNVPGDGARKAWAYMDERRGDGNVVCISHPNLTTDRLLGIASFDHTTYTPIAILYTEYIAFAVRSDSVFGTASDLLARMREDAASLCVALSTSLGNPNHIALARVVRNAGGDPGAPRVRVFDSALDAVGDLVAGNAHVAAVTAPSTTAALADGSIRVVAISSPSRMGGAFATVPAWKEEGIDCVVGAWRGLAGACDIAERDVTRWQHALRAAIRTRSWRTELERHGWVETYIDGPQLERFLSEERSQMAAALQELGLIPNSGTCETDANP